uniref:Receptor ligand binding region domain-containing protein n=1 Tax=Xiphophorus couchianus TaxID=32473 RepID=A0A3B5LNS1_9TELE
MCAGADRIREIMLAAHKQQLTNGSYMFFNVNLFNVSSYGEFTSCFSLNYGLAIYVLQRNFKKHYLAVNASNTVTHLLSCQVNMFVEGFHDAMVLYSIALHEGMKNGYSKTNGTEITSHMWNRTFEGIAGQVSIDVNGDRVGDFSLMAMTNIEAGSYEVIKILKEVPKKEKEVENHSCGLGVSALTGVTVGAVLGALMLIAFYFFRKNYRITIQRRTRVEESESMKHHQLREDSIRSNFSAA